MQSEERTAAASQTLFEQPHLDIGVPVHTEVQLAIGITHTGQGASRLEPAPVSAGVVGTSRHRAGDEGYGSTATLGLVGLLLQ